MKLTPELKAQLDDLAVALDRPRSWIVSRALEDHAAVQAWQIGEIRRGLAAAEAGDFVDPAELKAAFGTFRR